MQEADSAAATPGSVGALLCREGLYSSHLVSWRRERSQGIQEALAARKRGRKSQRNPLEEENQKLRCQNARLTEDLRKANIIIEVQKKGGCALRNPIPDVDPEETWLGSVRGRWFQLYSTIYETPIRSDHRVQRIDWLGGGRIF